MGKRIIGEMRKHGCQGNQLLTVMSQNQIKRTSRRNSFPALMGEQEVEVDSADAGSTQPKGGLGEALNQLAFAHDLDIAGVTSPARPDLETMCSASEPDNETRDCLQPSPDGRTMESPRNLLPEGLSRVDEDSVVSSTMICGQDVEDRVLLTPSQHEQQEVGYEPEMEPPRYDEIDFTVVVVPSGSEYKPTELLCSGDTFPVESSCVGNTITMESSISEKIFQMETSNSGDTLPVEGTNTPKSDIEDNIIVKEENIAEKDSILTNTACQTELSVFSCTPQSSESLLTCIGEQQIKAPIIVPVIQDSDVPRLSPNHRTSPQPSYDGELVLVPARLTDKPSLSSHRSTSAPHPKNKRRGLPRRLRKLTNKVAAVKLLGAAEKNTEACSCPSLPVVNRTASPPVVDTTSLEMSSRLSSLVSTTNTTTVTTTTAIPELSASSPLTIITTTDTSVPTSNVQSPSPSHQHIDTTSLGNPLQRWSTTSLSSMAALMAWQDEDDGGDCDGSDDQVS